MGGTDCQNIEVFGILGEESEKRPCRYGSKRRGHRSFGAVGVCVGSENGICKGIA